MLARCNQCKPHKWEWSEEEKQLTAISDRQRGSLGTPRPLWVPQGLSGKPKAVAYLSKFSPFFLSLRASPGSPAGSVAIGCGSLLGE